MMQTFKILFLFLISFYTYAQEKEIQEVNIINKRSAKKVIDLVEKKFKTNFQKRDTLTFQVQFYDKEEKLGEIYQLEGKLDFIFDNYLDRNNHYYDSFIYEDTKYLNNFHLLDGKKENYFSPLRNYLTPNLIYEIIKNRKQYHFSFIEINDEDIYKIEFTPLKSIPFRYKGFLIIDKKTFGILEFHTILLKDERNNFTTMFGARNDSYHISSYQQSCSFEKSKGNLFKVKKCNAAASINQKGNYNRNYKILGNIERVETPINSPKKLFSTDGFTITKE